MCNAFNDLIALYKLPPPPSIGRRGEAPFGFLTPINVASKIELIAKNCFGNSSFVNWKNPYQYFRTRGKIILGSYLSRP